MGKDSKPIDLVDEKRQRIMTSKALAPIDWTNQETETDREAVVAVMGA
jgi:hypothetical protein